jgi:alkanesulfonate monooxygenase SsuD/methylene tetrahydromethanopterin reductase-like flavin-dependent oxidoreductase (luciferase family)
MACVTPLRLAVALDGFGRPPVADHDWAEVVQEAERGKLDFVTFEDALSPEGDRLEAALIAARVALPTSRIGLVPTVAGPHSLHISTAIAALDQASSGRAGWRPQTGETVGSLDAATDVVEAVRRLWDDPEVAPPPQGQPVVVASADSPAGYRFAARSADLVLATPVDEDDVRRIVGEIRAEESVIGRVPGAATGPPLQIFADLAVFLDDTEATARDRQSRLDKEDEHPSDIATFAGTPDQLWRRLQSWQRAGITGFRLKPGELSHDLPAITRGLVPSLQENDAFRRGYEARTLRALLGLPRPIARAA